MDEPPSYVLSDLLSADNLPYIIASVMLIFLCGLISVSESAFFSLKPDQLDQLKRDEKRARAIRELLGHPRLLLTVLTTWKYVMLISCSVIFSIALNLTASSGIGTETIVLTIVFALFGAIIPKVYGSFHPVGIARTFMPFATIMVRITKPIVGPLLKMSVKVEHKLEDLSEERSVKELTQALELAAAEKESTGDEKEILQGIVNFGILTVDDVMRPQNEINSVDVSLNFHDLLLYIKKSGFSRLPAYRDSFDNIQGVLYIKDILPYLNESKTFSWQKFLRPAYFVLPSKKIDLLLKDFQEKRVHMALAIDDTGKVAGIITLEDIIEEIIGDIHDEFDEAGAYYKKIDEKTFVFDSKIPVSEFFRIIDIEPETIDVITEENETLGAMLVEKQKDLPKVGDKIIFDSITLVIEAVDHKRIKRIKVNIHEQKENE